MADTFTCFRQNAVKEAHCQECREHSKSAKQTFAVFAREKKVIFDMWCVASSTETFDQLQELLLLEDFKTCTAENTVMHINDQKGNNACRGSCDC